MNKFKVFGEEKIIIITAEHKMALKMPINIYVKIKYSIMYENINMFLWYN